MKIRFLNNGTQSRRSSLSIIANREIHSSPMSSYLLTNSLPPPRDILFYFAFSSIVHALFPPSSPDTRSRNQRVEPRTITQCNPPLSLSSSSSLSSFHAFFFLFFFSSSIFLSREEKKAHVPRIKLRFDLIIGIEVSFEERSIRIFRIFRAKLDMDILL